MIRDWETGKIDWGLAIVISFMILLLILLLIIIIGLAVAVISVSNNQQAEIEVDCYDRDWNVINEVTCTEDVFLNCNKLEDFYWDCLEEIK